MLYLCNMQRRLSKEEVDKLCEMYETGNYTFAALEEHFPITRDAIRGLLLRRGYKSKGPSLCHRKYSLNEEFFEKIDKEDKAYFLGFLYADGCNYPEGTRIIIALHEKDKDILEKFKLLLNYNRPLYYKKTKDNEGNQYVLTISSKKISQDLEKLGVVKAKSLILEFPTVDQVPENLYHHFIRGYFDGDGCIKSNLHKQYNRLDFRWSILGTEQFVKGAQQIMMKGLDLSKTKIRLHRSAYYLEYSGNKQCMKIGDWLYKDATIYLQRKYEKFKTIV